MCSLKTKSIIIKLNFKKRFILRHQFCLKDYKIKTKHLFEYHVTFSFSLQLSQLKKDFHLI